jgi:hypothetical protein
VIGSGDYISREAAIEAMYKDAEAHQDHTFWTTQYEALLNIPAADVVEVVRCKDCKYSEHWYRDKRLCRLWYGEEKTSAPIDVFDDGFCNYGERREDDA